MAKGNPLLGTMRGKLGDVVFTRHGGTQVSRPRIRNVKNPNSQKQQVARMVNATATQAYSHMRAICNHSFEGITPGAKSQAEFMRLNMSLLRNSIVASPDGVLSGDARMFFNPKGSNFLLPNNYKMSVGVLPPVVPISINDVSGASKNPSDIILGVVEKTRVVDNSCAALYMALKDGFFVQGHFYTFCCIVTFDDENDAPVDSFRFLWVRVMADYDESEGFCFSHVKSNFDLFPFVDGLVDIPSVCIGLKATDDSKVVWGIKMHGFFGDDFPRFAIFSQCVIHSVISSDGRISVSNAQMQDGVPYEIYAAISDFDFHVALDTWAGQTTAKGSGEYVLQGGTK